MTNKVDSANVQVPAQPAKAAKKAKAAAPVKAAKPAKADVVSKKSIAMPIIQAGLAAKTPRKETLEKLVKAGLSNPCASTYYQNVKSGLWK